MFADKHVAHILFWDDVREVVQSDIEEIGHNPRFKGDPRGKIIFEDCNR